MHIILTHEQADFDALASLLAAHLIDETALPVLPRRMNRNVQAFLTLYGLDLPFVDPRDLSGEPIEHVTLVDTQSMVSIRGMSAQTRVHVVDHHPPRENLPADWVVETSLIGATTTLVVETLREVNGDLSTIQATLLLLGIYEDTGSLTYTRTTSRDLRAAAFLMEQGASLQIVSNFLNHPLTVRQQAIYDQLRARIETLHIHGHTVLVACGDAQETDEEVSSIAHKLRDLLDPDALFVLVTTRSGVQMIARSTSDNIDVAAVLGKFGGGGHERAAAGLVKGRPLEEVRAGLVQILPEFIQPAITVAQIMSIGPQVVSTDTHVEEAALRMRRYGYEGYPVVQPIPSGDPAQPAGRPRVVGLLTRRAVDRAIAHKLDATAARVMEAGEYTVLPTDSIEHLQRLMTESGWGQIPVVSPEMGEIIGIVTRTDLLKTLTPQARLPSQQNLAERLEAALPAERLALLKTIAQAAHDHNAALYIVGGFVRDLLLERPSLDFDLTVEGDAIALAKALAKRYGGRVTSHSRFGTAKWFPDLRLKTGNQQSIDLVSARTEFYTHPTALPTVERGSIKLDLHRRDFTMNTLALRLDGRHYGELHDYWGGLNDLRHGLVRVLHSLSFVDDPTRILRAVRFEQRFGFRIEERSMELLSEALPLLARVSGDRLRHELNNLLAEETVTQALGRLGELDILPAIHPDLIWDAWLQTRLETLFAHQPDADWEMNGEPGSDQVKRDLAYTLWLLRLSSEQAQKVCLRLKLAASLQRTVTAACNLWGALTELAEFKPSQVVARLDETPPMARYAVYLATSDIHLRSVLQTYVTRWRKISPTITGRHLRARGLPPSARYKTILTALRNAWLDGEIASEEQESALVERLLTSNS